MHLPTSWRGTNPNREQALDSTSFTKRPSSEVTPAEGGPAKSPWGRAWLDEIHDRILHKKNIGKALGELTTGLRDRRQKESWGAWREFCVDVAIEHPLSALLHQCPFTAHGYARPRGYAGDAELLDYLYAENACPSDKIGSAIYRYIHRLPSAVAVRERCVLLAREIDDAALRHGSPRVLSVACGHLREVERSVAMREGRVRELIALDQDLESLRLIEHQYGHQKIRPVQDSVRSLLTGKTQFESLDLIYSAGLYDYLAVGTARRLTAVLFQMLAPGGELLIGNFAKYPIEVGYIEAFMDWWLVYRTPQEVRELMGEVPAEQIAESRLFHDSTKNVIYLRLVRR